MKRIVLSLALLASLFVGSLGLVPAPALAADPRTEVCRGVGAVDGSGGCTNDRTLTRVVRNIINIFSVVVGIVAVIMIIVAGFKYITSGGDSGNITSAKHTLVYAIIGLVVVALSQSIVQFVLDNVK